MRRKVLINNKNEKEILELLDEARYYHNYSCEEEKVIRICNHILKNNPENRDAMLIKAGSFQCLDREKKSFQLITKIIEKWPNHWEAYYLLGLLLFNTNEKMAMENFNRSIKLKKTFDNTIVAAQLAYFLQQDNYKEYLRCAEKIDAIRYNNYMKNFWEWEVC